MEPTYNFDDFDTQIQSDELIPDGYEDQELEGLDDAYAADDCPVDIDGGYDADGYYGNDLDGYDGGDDFPW